MSRYNYQRRESSIVEIGGVGVGGANPIRLQSMVNVSTNDIEAAVAQTERIVASGGEIVRLTTQGVKEATNIGVIREKLRERGCSVPIVADVHFNPQAAYVAAGTTDKVRINPGNFVDAARTFRKLEFSDEEYSLELERIRKSLVPFLAKCRENSTAIRLGVNHGSLSDRIMSRYGDTPAGMVESVMEYLRICREEDFRRIVISIKASNTIVMVSTVRLLVAKMESEGMNYPLHLGVTEAGDGEDGRIKSAVGIGTLLSEGIGDTIRVSLSEEPECEIPVARKLVEYISRRQGHEAIEEPTDKVEEARRHSESIPGFEGVNHPIIVGCDIEVIPEEWRHIDASSSVEVVEGDGPIVVSSTHINPVGEIESFIDRLVLSGRRNPVIVKMQYGVSTLEELQIYAGADFGTILINGYASGIWIESPNLSRSDCNRVALGILQAVRLRISKTEYIACPGCGRTLFDLQQTLATVKSATSHLKGLKIGVMGCIVNGPGEMADADYGYVGAASGKVSLYKNKECVERNIPQEEALSKLVALIKANGDWVEP